MCPRYGGAPTNARRAATPYDLHARPPPGRDNRSLLSTDLCSYHGWVSFGYIRTNGHPNGRRWRQLVCLSSRGYFLEILDTPFHGKQAIPTS
jgi:hypothetical protein